jgi:hypothetical protein
MIEALLRKVFGTKHERDVKRMTPTVQAIGALEPSLQALDDAGLRAKSDEFRQRVANGEPIDELLVEAFAVCREAARRTVRMRHFDVQLIGGMVLHQGKIAEMATGEGKTLVATLPAYLTGSPDAASTSSPSTTTWPSATRSGWGRSSRRSASRWASSSTRRRSSTTLRTSPRTSG